MKIDITNPSEEVFNALKESAMFQVQLSIKTTTNEQEYIHLRQLLPSLKRVSFGNTKDLSELKEVLNMEVLDYGYTYFGVFDEWNHYEMKDVVKEVA